MNSLTHNFVRIAAIILGAALLCVGTADALILRYEARLSAGKIPPRIVSASVLGIEIADAPHLTRIRMLTGALKADGVHLPWDRALVYQAHGPQALFFPVNGMREAFALCMKLAELPPSCAPVVANSNNLRGLHGEAVTPEILSSIGVAPYEPKQARVKLV